jgi:hypothetical protein
VSMHGYPRSTKDFDVCIKISEENASKMLQVIKDFGFASLKLAKGDFLKRDFITQLGHEPVRIIESERKSGKATRYGGY